MIDNFNGPTNEGQAFGFGIDGAKSQVSTVLGEDYVGSVASGTLNRSQLVDLSVAEMYKPGDDGVSEWQRVSMADRARRASAGNSLGILLGGREQ